MTCIGGKESNKHRDKRVVGSQGYNPQTKTAVLGLRQRGSALGISALRMFVVEDLRGKTVAESILGKIKRLGSLLSKA